MNATSAMVVGLGETGLSAVRHFRRAGIAVCCVDTRMTPPGLSLLKREFPEVEFVCTSHWQPGFEGIDVACISPGLDPSLPLLTALAARGVDCVGDVELFARTGVRGTVGVTGTNGKSTVATLLGAFARAAGENVGVGGNLMPPALDLLAGGYERHVLELSSFQLERVVALPLAVAVLLNLAPDHLDRYPDMHAYAAAKRRIFSAARVAIVPREDARCHPPAGFDGRVIEVPEIGSTTPTALWRIEDAGRNARFVGPAGAILDAHSLRLQGRHNWRNALFALSAGTALGYDPQSMLGALATFEGLAHRCEFVGERDGVRFVNDSKATNVHAAVAAIEGVGAATTGLLVLIAGGLAKEPDFSALARACAERVHDVLLIGREREVLRQALAHEAIVATECTDLRDAVRTGFARARGAGGDGATVLFAPACASFDEFDNYRARGDAFRAAVRDAVLAA